MNGSFKNTLPNMFGSSRGLSLSGSTTPRHARLSTVGFTFFRFNSVAIAAWCAAKRSFFNQFGFVASWRATISAVMLLSPVDRKNRAADST